MKDKRYLLLVAIGIFFTVLIVLFGFRKIEHELSKEECPGDEFYVVKRKIESVSEMKKIWAVFNRSYVEKEKKDKNIVITRSMPSDYYLLFYDENHDILEKVEIDVYSNGEKGDFYFEKINLNLRMFNKEDLDFLLEVINS